MGPIELLPSRFSDHVGVQDHAGVGVDHRFRDILITARQFTPIFVFFVDHWSGIWRWPCRKRLDLTITLQLLSDGFQDAMYKPRWVHLCCSCSSTRCTWRCHTFPSAFEQQPFNTDAKIGEFVNHLVCFLIKPGPDASDPARPHRHIGP